MSENSRQSIQIVAMIGGVAAIAGGGLYLNDRIDMLEVRLEKLEGESRVLSPLVNVMAAHRPGLAVPSPYEPVQATGEANAHPPGTDHSSAWCPAVENEGIEWLELGYENPVSAAAVRIHANFNPGAVVRVHIGGVSGPMRELPMLPDAATHVQTIPISPLMEVSRVKLELDTAIAPGWNEIDAVALLDAAGNPHWAASATASSYWNQPSE